MLDEQELKVAVGRAVRELRDARGLSQEEFAWRCGLHRTYVSSIERGSRNTSLVALGRIAAGLDVRLSRLFEAAERHLAD